MFHPGHRVLVSSDRPSKWVWASRHTRATLYSRLVYVPTHQYPFLTQFAATTLHPEYIIMTDESNTNLFTSFENATRQDVDPPLSSSNFRRARLSVLLSHTSTPQKWSPSLAT